MINRCASILFFFVVTLGKLCNRHITCITKDMRSPVPIKHSWSEAGNMVDQFVYILLLNTASPIAVYIQAEVLKYFCCVFYCHISKAYLPTYLCKQILLNAVLYLCALQSEFKAGFCFRKQIFFWKRFQSK